MTFVSPVTGVDSNADPQAFQLNQTTGSFMVLNNANVDGRNQPGGVEENGTITNDPNAIPQPQ